MSDEEFYSTLSGVDANIHFNINKIKEYLQCLSFNFDVIT